jgi:hypothetical protein
VCLSIRYEDFIRRKSILAFDLANLAFTLLFKARVSIRYEDFIIYKLKKIFVLTRAKSSLTFKFYFLYLLIIRIMK